jgi:hypothetical protein
MIQASADLPVNGSKPSTIKMITGKQVPVLFAILALEENALLKFIPYILTFCLMIYIVELIALSVYCKPSVKTEMSCSGKKESSCCRKPAAGSCNRTQKPNESNTATCCISNCPLFYVTTLSEVTLPSSSHDLIKRLYPSFQSSYIFTYSSPTWKPPNGC